MIVGLQKVAQILEIAVQEHAIRGVGLEVGGELRQIDAGHHRAVRDELRRARPPRRRTRGPASSRQAGARGSWACPSRRVDREVLKAAVAHALGAARGRREPRRLRLPLQHAAPARAAERRASERARRPRARDSAQPRGPRGAGRRHGSDRPRALQHRVAIDELHAERARLAVDEHGAADGEPAQHVARAVARIRARPRPRARDSGRDSGCAAIRPTICSRRLASTTTMPRAQQPQRRGELGGVLVAAVGDHHDQTALALTPQQVGGGGACNRRISATGSTSPSSAMSALSVCRPLRGAKRFSRPRPCRRSSRRRHRRCVSATKASSISASSDWSKWRRADARLGIVGAHPAPAVEQEHHALIAVVLKRPRDRTSVLERRLPVDVADRIAGAVFDAAGRSRCPSRGGARILIPSSASRRSVASQANAAWRLKSGNTRRDSARADREIPVEKAEDSSAAKICPASKDFMPRAVGVSSNSSVSRSPGATAKRSGMRRHRAARIRRARSSGRAAWGAPGFSRLTCTLTGCADREGMRQMAGEREGRSPPVRRC